MFLGLPSLSLIYPHWPLFTQARSSPSKIVMTRQRPLKAAEASQKLLKTAKLVKPGKATDEKRKANEISIVN